MAVNLAPVWIITRREVRDQFRDWRIIAPILVLTVFFPGLMNFTAAQAVSFVQRYGADLVGDRLIPFLLMVVGFFPISISLVIALESFVGEKERRSIEPLLSSPLHDWQLYLGKLLASMVPPLVASYLGILVYLVGVYRQVGWSPEPMLLVQILLLTTIQAVVMVSGAVVISTQTTSVRAANLLASFIIIPMALLIQAESVVMFWAAYSTLWWIIFAEALIAALLIRMGIAHFNREELLGRELDSLNLRWSWRVFWSSFRGRATSLVSWIGREALPGLRRLGPPVLLMPLILGGALAVGVNLSTRFSIPPELIRIENLRDGSFEGLELLQLYSVGTALTVWLHNLRVILLATVVGVFSFGILGILLLSLPMAIIGYLMGAASGAGISPLAFFGVFVLPHGILEIPAIILAGAAILRLGATLAAPAGERTISEAWLAALADWVRVMLVGVAPLLAGAALLEVFVTPQVVLWFFAQ